MFNERRKDIRFLDTYRYEAEIPGMIWLYSDKQLFVFWQDATHGRSKDNVRAKMNCDINVSAAEERFLERQYEILVWRRSK